ncbi:MAG: IS110 family transposase [Sphingomonas sp.]|nr:MAG: IS110 family transposase [Sphingomonas sp.]
MAQYIGLDVSLKDTFISVREDGRRIWRGKCPSDPKILAEMIYKRAPNVSRVVFETGPLSTWYYHELTAAGLPAICIDARQAKKGLDMARNKTDANDADGLAHLAEAAFYKQVRVKSYDNMLVRTLVTARTQLLKMQLQLSNQIRGLMKTFGLIVPKGLGRVFDGHVCDLAGSHPGLAPIILPLLAVWRELRVKVAGLSKQLVGTARQSKQCQLLTSIPGVGALTACSFIAAIEDPANFARSRSVGAWLGLTTRRYQSGEVDYDGHISRRGDVYVRGLLYEAATVILTRAHADSDLRQWGIKLREKVGFKRAAIAVARKLSVVMHAMLKSGECFERRPVTTA